ncbi:hypothetical protein AAG570_012498 [Ranatra chinensis]|uniref:Uncharacterized protein n=1 Tax=Ranatra chinensis TaxID=642074 RepID=A0ABD0YWI3_9HEMI
MASKRRNMFHKNKTQETTEIGRSGTPVSGVLEAVLLWSVGRPAPATGTRLASHSPRLALASHSPRTRLALASLVLTALGFGFVLARSQLAVATLSSPLAIIVASSRISSDPHGPQTFPITPTMTSRKITNR